MCSALVLTSAAAASAPYGWPVRPFDEQHPIRGFFGDPRTVFDQALTNDGVDGPGSFSFHNGVDISAPNGTPVYPVVGGIVHMIDASALSVHTFDGRTFQYFHVVPTVVEGERVFSRLSLLGYVQAPFEHVHLGELDGDRITNPLLADHLTPYADETRPIVGGFELRGAVETPTAVCGRVTITASAFDVPPLPVPGQFAGMPVAPALVTWGLRGLSGFVAVPRETAVDFRTTLPRQRDFWRVYARGSYQNAPRFGSQQFKTLPGRFLYRLADLDTTTLPDGVYRIAAKASDERGNYALGSGHFRIDNRGDCAPPAPAPAPQSP